MAIASSTETARGIAKALLRAKRNAEINGKQLFEDDLVTIIEPMIPRPVLNSFSRAPIPRKRNDLLDALVFVCGGNPHELTSPGLRTAAVALADIKTVCPSLTIMELEDRVTVYKRKHPQWDLTPASLAKWWAECGHGAPTRTAKRDIYDEPIGWRPVLRYKYQLSEEAVRDKQWADLGPDTRREILSRMFPQ